MRSRVFALAGELEKGLALEIEHLLFAQSGAMRDVAARQDAREVAANRRVVIADASGSMRQVDAERERGIDIGSADGIAARIAGGWYPAAARASAVRFASATRRSRFIVIASTSRR